LQSRRKVEFREEFQFVPCSGAFGIPSGPVFKPAFISSRDPAKWPELLCSWGGSALGRAAAGTFYFSMQENQGGANEAPIQDLTHTHVFGWDALRHEPGARQPGLVQRGHTTITLRGLGRITGGRSCG
jgi:hypothetical protein